MDRLTKNYEDGTFGVADNLPCGENSYAFKDLLIKTLGAYERAEEQGLLIKLPCKVGDTIYHKPPQRLIHKAEVCEITLGEENINYRVWDSVTNNYYNYSNIEFGKTVFLTKEEAEAKLAELRGDKDAD